MLAGAWGRHSQAGHSTEAGIGCTSAEGNGGWSNKRQSQTGNHLPTAPAPPPTVPSPYLLAAWKTPAHPLRSDSRFKLSGIPTLVQWKGGAVTATLGGWVG